MTHLPIPNHPPLVLPQSGETCRPEILTQPPPEVRVQPGQEVRLVVVAHGRDQLSYQWYCEAQPLPYGTARELVLSQVTPDDSGTYTCSISSPTGGSVISNPARVLVSPLPSVYPPPHPQQPFSHPHIPTNVPPAHTQWVHPANAESSMVFTENGLVSPLPTFGSGDPGPYHQTQTRYGSVSPPEDRPRGQGGPHCDCFLVLDWVSCV